MKKKVNELTQKHFQQREKLDPSIAEYFLACSKEAAQWMYGNLYKSLKIIILKNAIDIEKYAYNEIKRKKIRNKLGIANKFVIGNIGRFVYQKNHEFLVDVFYLISQDINNAVLLFIGGGELEQKIRSKVKKMGIENKVEFLGKRNDVNVILQGLDIFALPSRFEGFPFSMIEAQASGVPCIAGNVPKEIQMNEHTYVIELNKEKWVKCIIDIYNFNGRDNIGEKLIKNHNIKYQVKELEKLYLQ